jgi:CBS domain-containing protein
MSREVATVDADAQIRDAARVAAQSGHRGLPVVDAQGRCVGMLSVTDLARWAGRRHQGAPLPRTCAFQEKIREPGGQETILCLLGEGECPFQRTQEMPGGGTAVICSEPHCVPTDWQMVETEAPATVVRDIMTSTVVDVGPGANVTELARLMIDRGIHRLVVLDADRRPIGIVAVNDLLQVLAHPELTPAGGQA